MCTIFIIYNTTLYNFYYIQSILKLPFLRVPHPYRLDQIFQVPQITHPLQQKQLLKRSKLILEQAENLTNHQKSVDCWMKPNKKTLHVNWLGDEEIQVPALLKVKIGVFKT